jgi:hypothetical protein
VQTEEERRKFDQEWPQYRSSSGEVDFVRWAQAWNQVCHLVEVGERGWCGIFRKSAPQLEEHFRHKVQVANTLFTMQPHLSAQLLLRTDMRLPGSASNFEGCVGEASLPALPLPQRMHAGRMLAAEQRLLKRPAVDAPLSAEAPCEKRAAVQPPADAAPQPGAQKQRKSCHVCGHLIGAFADHHTRQGRGKYSCSVTDKRKRVIDPASMPHKHFSTAELFGSCCTCETCNAFIAKP